MHPAQPTLILANIIVRVGTTPDDLASELIGTENRVKEELQVMARSRIAAEPQRTCWLEDAAQFDYDIAGWLARTDAKPLVAGVIAREIPTLSAEAREELKSLAWFGGHNAFLGGGEKERAIRTLHELARRPDRPSREAVQTFLRSCLEVPHDGASRVGTWYDEVLAGKRHRDYAGRVI